MRKFLWLAIAGAFVSGSVIAQDSNLVVKKKDWSKISLANRANDHFMIGIGYDGWAGATDSLNIKGLSRHFNVAVMYDIPFKTNPRLSFAGGIGVSSSSIFFDETNIDIAGKLGRNRIVFSDAGNTNHFKKYKLSTTYVEIPLELRFVKDPLHSGKSFKFAVGVKLGTMLDAHTKGKNLVNADGNSLYGSKYKEKEKSSRYFNSTKLAGTVRVGYGAFTLFGSYQINTLFKENQGPVVRPYSIGLCLSGL
jgi:hypothetical protein